MDSSGYRIEFLGNSCGQHGSYTFYRGVRYWKDDKCHSLSLGEFFHGRMSSNDQVIPLIGELQLLWEEKHHEGLKLSSVRLYILPENCPGGRLPHHGQAVTIELEVAKEAMGGLQDEILAEDDKVVLRVEDLMKLVVLEPVVWTNGLLALHKFCPQDILTGSNGLKANSFMLCQSACQGNANNRTSNNNGTRVVILSYSRYCRYRAALKRFEGCTNRWLADFLVSAIGGFSTCSIETRVMFCRNTVEHPVLESYECRMNHLAPSLKGRRRKQRPKSKPNESEDSNESETNSEKNSLRCKKTSEGPLEKRKPIGKLSEGGKLSELNNRANPKCKKTAVNNEKGFLKRLHKYMNDRGRPIVRIPTLGFKEVNLYQFYQCTQQLGGYNEVTEKRLWKHVYDQLGGSPGNTSAATGTRKNYEKLLLDYEQHCRNRKKRSVSTDVEMKKSAASSAKDSAESSSVSQMDSSEATTAAGDGSSCNSSSVSSQDAGKTHGTGSQSIDGSGDASQQQQQKLVGSDGLPKQQPSGAQSKNAVKLKKQKKLLRKKSLQGYTDSVPVNDTKKLSLSTAKQNPESMKSKQEPPGKDVTASAIDLLQSPSTKSDNSQAQAEDQKHLVSVSSLKAIEAATIVPCKVAMTMLKTKSSEVLENCTKKGVPNGRVLPVKVEQPESMEGDTSDSSLSNYLCSATTVLPVTASAVDDVNFEERKFVPCVGVIALPQKSKSSAGSEIGSKDSCAKTTSTIRTSSVSRKLLSGGHAVVESGTVDKDQSKHLLSEKTETCSMKLSSNMLPIRQVVEELLASKSLGIPHPFNGGAMASRYSLGGVAPLTPSSPGLPPSGLSSLEAALSSEPNKKEARLCVKKESSIRPSSAIQFSVDNINARDAVFEFVEDKCYSGVPTPQPMTSSSICPVQSKQQSALKRSQPFSLPSESHVDAKKQRTEQERPASNQSVERPPTCHQTSVISSPIKRFIDRTKNWVPPPPPLPPPLNSTAQTATSQSSSWTSDDQPTDLSMKTLMSRQQQQQQQQSNCLSSLVLPQDEPLDLSKTSSLFPRSMKNEASARPPVVLPGSVAAQAFQRNGLNLTTSTNKVAFVAPSLRSTSSFLPPTSYQMSHFQSMNNISSMQQPLKPEQLAPLVAYAPFHPAFQILSTPILSALAGSGSLLCSSSSPSAVSPRLAVPLYPVIPITQNAAISASDRIPSILEMGNSVSSSIFKRASRKS